MGLRCLRILLVELSDSYLTLLKGDTPDLSPEAHELLRCFRAWKGGIDVRRLARIIWRVEINRLRTMSNGF